MASRKNKRTKTKSKTKRTQLRTVSSLVLPDGDQDFNLETFEGLVYRGEHISAVNYLLKFLACFDSYRILAKEGETPIQLSARIRRWFTRLAAASCALFTSPNWNFPDDIYFYICRFQDWLSKIYEMSHVCDGNYVLDLINSTQYRNDEQMLKRFLLHMSLSTPQELYQMLLVNKDLSYPVVLSMVGDSCTLDVEQENNRGILIQNFPSLSDSVKLKDDFLGGLHKPWMFCSYAVDEHRHLVKLEVNKVIAQMLSHVKPSTREHANTEKPKLAVLIEVCRSDHAMYRCFGPLLQSLRDRFHVTFIATQKSIDGPVASLADECVYIDYQSASMQNVAEMIVGHEFDMIYYPSIGMSVWTIIMANLRLAPIQCYSLGHPATTCSQYIDFAVCDEDTLSDPLCFTEKLLLAKGVASHTPHPNSFEAQPQKNDGIVRIAIVSKFMKLNSLLINVCQQINAKTSCEVQFHIFPDTGGMLLEYVRHKLNEQLPNCAVYPTVNYQQYMNLLSVCDLRLGTYPFGGTNSTVDCISLGIPVVTMDGPEIFSHADSVLLERYCGEHAKNLVASDLEDFVDKCIDLVENTELRDQISDKLKSIDLDKAIFLNNKDAKHGLNAETLMWAYKNFHQIMSSEQQVIKID